MQTKTAAKINKKSILILLIAVSISLVYNSNLLSTEKDQDQPPEEKTQEQTQEIQAQTAPSEEPKQTREQIPGTQEPEEPEQQEQSQTVEQEIKPTGSQYIYIYLGFPKEVDEIGCIQHVHNLTVDYSIEPTIIKSMTIDNGENYTVVYWERPLTSKLIVSIETIVSREVNHGILAQTDPHPYPIATDLLPENIKPYLGPTFLSQSDNPDIITLAEELAAGLEDEAEIVTKTVLWVNQNIEWKCFRDIMKEYHDVIVAEYGFFTWTAAEALKYRVGVCADFADLTIALLRAQGIPSRSVHGFVAHPDNPTPEERLAGHAWIQVYYPKIDSWVNYDPTISAAIYLPHHIEFVSSGYGIPSGDYTEHWYAVGLGNNTVKIVHTVTVLPPESEESEIPEEQPEALEQEKAPNPQKTLSIKPRDFFIYTLIFYCKVTNTLIIPVFHSKPISLAHTILPLEFHYKGELVVWRKMIYVSRPLSLSSIVIVSLPLPILPSIIISSVVYNLPISTILTIKLAS